VPRFYFDVREGAKLTSDEAGRELDSLETAERVAAEAAAEIARDQVPHNSTRAVTVDLLQTCFSFAICKEISKVCA
jgi:hypothetical protein